jgi:VCBS repeat-containing protein
LTVDTWNGNANNDWSNGANWSLVAPPASGEEAVIGSDGMPTISSDVTLDNVLVQNAGTITVALEGTLHFDDGSAMSGGGALIINSGAALDVCAGDNGAGATLQNVAVNNSGAVHVGADATLAINGPVTGTGSFTIGDGATLELDNSVASGLTISFAGETGLLKVDALTFQGAVTGSLSCGDIIDLGGGLNTQVGDVFTTATSFDGTLTTLTITDTTQTESESLTLLGDYTGHTFTATADGSGGVDVYDPPAANPSPNPSVASTAKASSASGTVTFADNDADTLTANVTPEGSHYVGTFTLDPLTQSNGDASLGFHFDLGDDQINLAPGQTLTQSYGISITDAQNPAMNVTQTVAVTVGGPENDNFVFKPGLGADTIIGFNQTNDTIELDHFANAQTVQQLESLITSDAHGDAVIALGNHDSITLAGVNAAQLHQLAQSGHVILH